MDTNKTSTNLDAFQQMLLQMRNAFIADVPEKLDQLDNLLFGLEKNGFDSESFNTLYRIVHSLKGSGGTHGLHIITTICHQLEDFLGSLNSQTKFTPELINFCLSYVDLLRTATKQIQIDQDDFQEIENKLPLLRQQFSKKQFTVLIVDNSKLSTQIYLQLFSKMSVNTVAMSDGLQALTRALTEHFDLLITGNEIPSLTGAAIIGALRLSNSPNSHIKSILITANKDCCNDLKRYTDANYVIMKDAKWAENLADAVNRALPVS